MTWSSRSARSPTASTARARAADDAQRAYYRAALQRRPVVLMLPIDIQPQPPAGPSRRSPPPPPLPAYEPSDGSIKAVADLLQTAKRPAIIGGRGAVLADARDDLYWLGRADRRGDGDLGARQRPVHRSPLLARDLRRSRVTVRDQAAARAPTW